MFLGGLIFLYWLINSYAFSFKSKLTVIKHSFTGIIEFKALIKSHLF